MKDGEDKIQALLADCNKQYEAAEASGKPAGELEQMQKSLQAKINDEVARLQRAAQMMESALEMDLEKAIALAAREKGVSTVFTKDLFYVGGVDITDETIKQFK